MTENEEEVINLLLAQVSHLTYMSVFWPTKWHKICLKTWSSFTNPPLTLNSCQAPCMPAVDGIIMRFPHFLSVIRKMRSWQSRRSWSLLSRCFADRSLPRRKKSRGCEQRSQTYRGETRPKPFQVVNRLSCDVITWTAGLSCNPALCSSAVSRVAARRRNIHQTVKVRVKMRKSCRWFLKTCRSKMRNWRWEER